MNIVLFAAVGVGISSMFDEVGVSPIGKEIGLS